MNVIFRADSSTTIGSGHVMRCLTLADELRANGCEIVFICRELSGNLISLIEKKNYSVYKLEVHDESKAFNWEIDANETISLIKSEKICAELLVIDHYQLDCCWEIQLRSYTRKIMVIDDLANRHHDCDLLLDQNYYNDFQLRYDALVPSCCKKLLGPKYTLLRPEYLEARKKLRVRSGVIKHILVFFGSSDLGGQTIITLDAIQSMYILDIQVAVVIGASTPNREEIEEYCAGTTNITLHCQVDNMAELMRDADLAIGAGGASMWERCFLGLPAITVILADNQASTTMDVAQYGAIKYLGWSSQVAKEDYMDAIQMMLADPEGMREISERARSLMDYSGTIGSKAVASAILN